MYLYAYRYFSKDIYNKYLKRYRAISKKHQHLCSIFTQIINGRHIVCVNMEFSFTSTDYIYIYEMFKNHVL